MTQLIRMTLILFLAMGLSSCRGGLLNVFVVPEQTVLENQVIGTYEDLGRELTVYASVRAIQPDGSLTPAPPTTPSRQAALDAMRNRLYNEDDVQFLLRNDVVGEGRFGLLTRRVTELSPVGTLTPDAIQLIIEEENNDRMVLIQRLIRTTPGVSEEDRPEVEWIFATLNQDAAPSGAWIEDQQGQWRRK